MDVSQIDPQLQPILNNPAAPRLAAELTSALEEEQKRRNAFYEEYDDDIKAEFINGEIIVDSPVKKEHADVSSSIFMLMNTYVRLNKQGYVGQEKIMVALTRNDYEPDVVYFNKKKAIDFKKGQWKFPAPDLAVEVVSNGTEARDRGVKFEDYALHGVEEYWIVDPEEESVEQYLLDGDAYKLHLKAGQGNIYSKVIEGFSVDIRAIFDEEIHLKALKAILG